MTNKTLEVIKILSVRFRSIGLQTPKRYKTSLPNFYKWMKKEGIKLKVT